MKKLTSADCSALAGSVGTLVAVRAVQAVGAALLVPTSLSLVLAAYPAERRGGAVRTWTAMGGLAAGLGPVLGGLLVTVDWRWVFVVNVPIGLAAVVIGWRVLRDAPGDRGAFPDTLGALLLTAGISALTLGLVKGNDWGWASGRVVGLLVGAGVATALFLVRSARHPSPVLELSLLRVRTFGVTLAAALLFSAAFGGGLLALVLWLQERWGWSALRTGFAVAPGPLMVPPVTVLAGKLIRRIGPGLVIAAGCTVYAVGQLWSVAAVGLRPDYPLLLCGLLITGVGVGLTLPTLISTAAGALPAHRFATGSVVVSMVRSPWPLPALWPPGGGSTRRKTPCGPGRGTTRMRHALAHDNRSRRVRSAASCAPGPRRTPCCSPRWTASGCGAREPTATRTPCTGWWETPGGSVCGAYLRTPPYPALLADVPDEAVDTLVDIVAGMGSVNAERGLAEAARLAEPVDRRLLISWYEIFGEEVGDGHADVVAVIDDRICYGGLVLWEDGGEPVSMAGAAARRRERCGSGRSSRPSNGAGMDTSAP